MNTQYCANDIYVATPSDTAEQPGCGFVFTGGDCAVVTDLDETRVIPAAFAGLPFAVRIKQVLATDTTATSVLVYR